MADDIRIEIDDIAYRLAFSGFNKPMNAWSPNGAEIALQPWPLGEHLRTLNECAILTATGLKLDVQAFGRRILEYCKAPQPLHQLFLPLALWWANGGEAPKPTRQGDVYQFSTFKARLRPWSAADRYAALADCQYEDEQGEIRFNLGAYLLTMLEASVLTLDPSHLSLAELDSASTNALLNTVSELNVIDSEALAKSPLGSPLAAQQTLRLCRELGWTPSQVWSTPAAELDRLSQLLDITHPQTNDTASAGPTTTFTDHPDTVIIRIEDD